MELLILFELWAGERVSLEKAHPRYLRPGRPFPVSAVPFGRGIDIWRSCRFIGTMMRSLYLLPGALGRLCLALLVLIIAGFVILVGRSVVMVLRLDLVRVPLSFSWMSFWVSFVTLLGLRVLYLLALFSIGIVLLGLRAGPPLGGCLFLVRLMIWLLLVLVLFGRLMLMVLVSRFTGLVVLVLEGKEFD